jgi:hypothetical protein
LSCRTQPNAINQALTLRTGTGAPMHSIVLFILIALSGAAAGADDTIRRLPPSAFSELPSSIRQTLEQRKCLIPQIWEGWKLNRHNVIRGAFFEKRQVDWAVLCSVKARSTILVFKQGSSQPVAELALANDQDFVQVVEPGTFGFSRVINPTGRKRILKTYQENGGTKPPPLLDHQGINDAFAEKASVIHYFYNGEWLKLPGAD